MSWQASSLALLGLALAAGFAWYEREKPPARVLAVVAALAALAVVGRLAFAAFPNVKPTTDIVLFAGYALGAVPGFAVGAVTAIVSNIFLSQGPWTVWQMAGWGAVGVGGAVLAKVLRGREPNRFMLAAVCGLAGLLFGAWMDIYQWTFAARQDLDTYIAVAGTSLPYNVAHAVGNVVFCLLLGPGLPARARPLPAPPRGALGALARADRGQRGGARAGARSAGGRRRRHAGEARRDLPAARAEQGRRLRRGARSSARARSTPAGPASGSPRRAATRATSSAAADARPPPTCCAGAPRSGTSGRSSAPCCSLGRPAWTRAASGDATCWPRSRSAAAATARSLAS